MAEPKLRMIPDILEEHFEELQFLWAQRRAALEAPSAHFERFVKHDQAEIRQAGWRAAVFGPPLRAETYQAGIKDGNPATRREALFAAAWGRQAWLLDHCRKAANTSSPEAWDALLVLAILGKPQDLPQILVGGQTTAFGSQRFRLLG